jgi:hypothetical protein
MNQIEIGKKVMLLDIAGNKKEYTVTYLNGTQVQVRDDKTFFHKWVWQNEIIEVEN